MTVMLLQRFFFLQSTHSQKTTNNNINFPFLFLSECQEKRTNNSNNNSINNKGTTIYCNSAGSIATITKLHGKIGAQDVAMRYYRLWIYACNLVLFGSAVGFAVTLSRIFILSRDPRRHLIPGTPRALDPTALYTYLALGAQLGLIQILGYIAAKRLSARLLKGYWFVLLALLFGDTVIGVAWVFRFERMRSEVRPILRLRLQVDYAKEPRFSEQWDRLQKEFSCCGVVGPRDFGTRWPQTCCVLSSNVNDTCQQPHTRGCEEPLMRWLRRTADLLFVLGFCVIVFVKICFLGILRYEIQEMIQKIRLLREPPLSTSFAQSFPQIIPDPTSNGSIGVHTTLPTSTSVPGNATLPLQSDECNTEKHSLLGNTVQDGGADSDTNSHCALILEETSSPTVGQNCGNREKSNGNNNYEMREFNRRPLFSKGGSLGSNVATGSKSRHT